MKRLKSGKVANVYFYSLPYGGYWSVKDHNGHEVFYPTEEDAVEAFDRQEFEAEKEKVKKEVDKDD